MMGLTKGAEKGFHSKPGCRASLIKKNGSFPETYLHQAYVINALCNQPSLMEWHQDFSLASIQTRPKHLNF